MPPHPTDSGDLRLRCLELRLRSVEDTTPILQRAMRTAPEGLGYHLAYMDMQQCAIRRSLDDATHGAHRVEDALSDIEKRGRTTRAPLEPYGDWVSTAFRDPNYAIVGDIPGEWKETMVGGGECLYVAMAMALPQTTPAHLRLVVSQAATRDEYITKKTLYESAKHDYPQLLERLQRTPRNTRTYVSLYDAVQRAAADRQNYRWLEGVNDISAFRQALALNDQAWGDGEALGKLQLATNTRALIVSRKLSQGARGAALYESRALVPDDWEPTQWVILAYDEDAGPHFDLVSYAGRRLFHQEDTLPFSMRRLMGMA